MDSINPTMVAALQLLGGVLLVYLIAFLVGALRHKSGENRIRRIPFILVCIVAGLPLMVVQSGVDIAAARGEIVGLFSALGIAYMVATAIAGYFIGKYGVFRSQDAFGCLGFRIPAAGATGRADFVVHATAKPQK